MTLKDYIEQYKTAIEARNFHYQNFSTWTAYFSVIVGALFVAFYSVKDSGSFSVLVALIGFVVSLCWHWSNKGYTYWWHHWSLLLDDMENVMSDAYKNPKNPNVSTGQDNEEGNKGTDVNVREELYGRVYSVFYDVDGSYFNPIKPANISTSKVALLMSFIITVAWLYLICLSIFECCNVEWHKCLISALVAVIGTFIITSIIGKYFKSDLGEHLIIKKEYRTEK